MTETRKDTQFFINELSKANAVNKQLLNGPNAFRAWLLVDTEEEHNAFLNALYSMSVRYPAQFMAFIKEEAKKPTTGKDREALTKLQNLIRQ